MFNEKALRRPEWVEGVKVTLGDGQEWTMPESRVEFRPAYESRGLVQDFGGVRRTIDHNFDAKLEAFLETEVGTSQEAEALRELAILLLSVNYRLDPDQYRALLPLRADDAVNRKMWQRIADVALGNPQPDSRPGEAVLPHRADRAHQPGRARSPSKMPAP